MDYGPELTALLWRGLWWMGGVIALSVALGVILFWVCGPRDRYDG